MESFKDYLEKSKVPEKKAKPGFKDYLIDKKIIEEKIDIPKEDIEEKPITEVSPPYIDLREAFGYLQYKMLNESEKEWKDLLPIKNLVGKDGAPGADGKDGVDGKPGADGISGINGADGIPGKDGVDGKTPIIRKKDNILECSYDGELWEEILLLDEIKGKDGVDGKPGADGKDGVDGKPGADGKDGVDGKPGTDGKDGKTPNVSIIKEDNQLKFINEDKIIPLINLKEFVGEKGEPGKPGINGVNGLDGKPGADGKDGVDGLKGEKGDPGKDGRDGVDGKDGAPGIDGKDGRDGIDGKDGIDGRDGRDGVDGKDGAPGIDGREVEFYNPNNQNVIYWRYKGAEKWDFLADLRTPPQTAQSIIGAAGPQGPRGDRGIDGKGVEMQITAENVLQWRPIGGTWANLIDLDTITPEVPPGEGITISANGVEISSGVSSVDFITEGEISVLGGIATVNLGEEMKYTSNVDFDGDYIYKGEAVPGTASNESIWRISKTYIDPATDDITITWADGDTGFNNVWDNRKTYSYS